MRAILKAKGPGRGWWGPPKGTHVPKRGFSRARLVQSQQQSAKRVDDALEKYVGGQHLSPGDSQVLTDFVNSQPKVEPRRLDRAAPRDPYWEVGGQVVFPQLTSFTSMNLMSDQGSGAAGIIYTTRALVRIKRATTGYDVDPVRARQGYNESEVILGTKQTYRVRSRSKMRHPASPNDYLYVYNLEEDNE